MKIIKSGKPSTDSISKRFVCVYCGCVFVADNKEYNVQPSKKWDIHAIFTCNCPECGHEVETSECWQ